MKRFWIATTVLSLFATSAHAFGVDLTVNACPGNSAASADAGTLDCAGGQSVALLAAFMPYEAIPDLVGVDFRFVMQVSGDITAASAFWDFADVNQGAVSVNGNAPATGCDNYRNLWTGPNSASAWGAALRSPSNERIATTCYNLPGAGFAVAPNERVFGVQLLISTGSSVEAGGAQPGCNAPVCIAVDQCIPGSLSNVPVTTLTSPSAMGILVTMNEGGPYMCYAVPAVRHTWGQLKTLYR